MRNFTSTLILPYLYSFGDRDGTYVLNGDGIDDDVMAGNMGLDGARLQVTAHSEARSRRLIRRAIT